MLLTATTYKTVAAIRRDLPPACLTQGFGYLGEYDLRGKLREQGHEYERACTVFDVFDTEGRFLDSFFVPTKGRVVLVQGDFLYVSEPDEEDLPSVVKYRIDR